MEAGDLCVLPTAPPWESAQGQEVKSEEGSSGGRQCTASISLVDFACSREPHCRPIKLMIRIAPVRCQQIISLSLKEDFAC